MLIKKKTANVIESCSIQDFVKILCCKGEVIGEKYLERTCANCKNKQILTDMNLHSEDSLMYEEWIKE